MALVIFELIAGGVAAGAGNCPRRTGIWGDGPVEVTAAERDIALYAAGPSLRVVRITTPELPEIQGQLTLAARIRDLAIDDRVAAAALGHQGFSLVDLSDPEMPSEILRVARGGIVEAVALGGDHLVLSISVGRFPDDEWYYEAFDVVDPQHPRWLGSFAPEFYGGDIWQRAIAVGGRFAYALVMDEIAVVDLEDPAGPRVLSIEWEPDWGMVSWSLDLELEDGLLVAAGVAIDDDWLDYVSSLSVYRTDEHGGLSKRGSWSYEGYNHWTALAVAGNVLSVGRYQNLRFLTVTESGQLRLQASVALQGHPETMALGSGFIAVGNGELQIVDIRELGFPRVVRHLASAQQLQALVAEDGSAYAVTWPWAPSAEAQLFVFSLADHGDLEELATLSLGRLGVVDAAIEQGMLVISTTTHTLEVMTVDDPRHPVLRGQVGISGNCELAMARGVAYAACGGDWGGTDILRTIDLSRLDLPQVVGAKTIPSYWLEPLLVEGNLALVTAHGVNIYSLASPLAPQLLCEVDRWYGIEDGAASGSMLYLVGEDGIRMLDLEDPSNPQDLGLLPTASELTSAAVYGDQLWVSSFDRWGAQYFDAWEVEVYDISDPERPRLVRGDFDPRGVTHVVGEGDVVLAASPLEGLVRFSRACLPLSERAEEPGPD